MPPPPSPPVTQAIYDALVSDAMDVLGRDGLEMVKALMGWSPQERTLHDANNERTLEAALYSDYFGGYYKKIRAWSHVRFVPCFVCVFFGGGGGADCIM